MIPRLHLVTDDTILSREDFLKEARRVFTAGKERVALHIRGPGLPGQQIFDLVKALKASARKSGTLLLVNDRVDVALALDLSGAHLGQRSLPPAVARKLLGPDRVLGISAHGVRESVEGQRGGADFVLVGTLYETPSHPKCVPGGPERIEDVAPATTLPLLGIGGITQDRVREVMVAGGYGVAVRGGVWETEDPAEAVKAFLVEIEANQESG